MTDPQDKKPATPPLNAKEEAIELFKTALIAVVLAVLIRSLFYEPFNIPSGSMKPTLLVGDYLFVSKPAYGYSRYSFPFGLAPIEGRIMPKAPRRGDVIVFRKPKPPHVNYIKRLVALPGETVQMRDGLLYINGRLVPREEVGRFGDLIEYTETLPGDVKHSIYEETDYSLADNTPIFTVPQGHYFMMGDNRDHSTDSRFMDSVGFVPYENLVGRADVLFFSTNGKAQLLEIWKWPITIRYKRFFKSLSPVRNDG